MVKTHLRDMIIVPEMIGSVVGVYVSFIPQWTVDPSFASLSVRRESEAVQLVRVQL